MTSILRAKRERRSLATYGCLSRIYADEMSSLDIIVSDAIITPLTCRDCANYFTAG